MGDRPDSRQVKQAPPDPAATGPRARRPVGSRSAVSTDVGLGEAGARRPSAAPAPLTADFGPVPTPAPAPRAAAVPPRPEATPARVDGRDTSSRTVDYGSVANAMEALGLERPARPPAPASEPEARDASAKTADYGSVADAIEALGLERAARAAPRIPVEVREGGPWTEDLGEVLPEPAPAPPPEPRPVQPFVAGPAPIIVPRPVLPPGAEFRAERSGARPQERRSPGEPEKQARPPERPEQFARDLWRESERAAVDPEPQPTPPPKRYIGFVLAALALAAAIWFIVSPGDTRPPPSAPGAAPRALDLGSRAPTFTPPTAAPAIEAPVVELHAQTPGDYQATVTSRPPGALVALEGRAIGYTPTSVTWSGKGRRVLALTLPEHHTATIALTPKSHGRTLDVALEPASGTTPK